MTNLTSPNLTSPNLTQHPPRSPRVKLGGYAHLPRLLDKARALHAGTIGEYHYNCPMDQQFFRFTGIDHEAFLEAVKSRPSDSEMIAWVKANTKRLPYEIAAWSAWLTENAPGGAPGHEWLGGSVKAIAAERDDIHGFFDLLDLDDFVSFGGKG